MDLGDQNSAVAPRAILPLCFTLHKMQLLSSASSAFSASEGRQKLSPLYPSLSPRDKWHCQGMHTRGSSSRLQAARLEANKKQPAALQPPVTTNV